MKTVCFFGIYDPSYARNAVLIQGFRELGWNVIECRVDPREIGGSAKYIKLIKLAHKIGRNERIDMVFVAFPGQTVVWLARFLFWGKFIVFDAFTSLFDSNVHDRKLYGPWSLSGVRDFVLDLISLRAGSVVSVDTHAHAGYFSRTFWCSAKKFMVIHIGTTAHTVESQPESTRVIQFHGSFIPLQGIEYIIRAAKICSDIPDSIFRVIGGSNAYYRDIQSLADEIQATNIIFDDRMPFAELMKKVASAHIILGIFGTTAKASRVIPNKVYEAIGMGKAIITADTPAARELLVDRANALLVPAGDPERLAAAVRELMSDSALHATLQSGARALADTLRPRVIVESFVAALESKGVISHLS